MSEFGDGIVGPENRHGSGPMVKEYRARPCDGFPSPPVSTGQGQRDGCGELGPPSSGAGMQGLAAPFQHGGSSPPPVTCFGCDPLIPETAPKCDDCASFDEDYPNWDGYLGVDGDDIR